MTLSKIFATPVFVVNLGEPYISEIQNFYSDFTAYEKVGSSSNHSWDCDVETSFFTNGGALSRPQMGFFLDKIEKHVLEYIDPYITESWSPSDFAVQIWLNRYRKGQYQESHNHVGNDISFNYVLKLEGMDNKFVVVDYSKPCAEATAYKSGIDFFQAKQEFELKTGDLILFPSWLNHYVTPSDKEGERITVSGNLNF